jgi:hypothetical protein
MLFQNQEQLKPHFPSSISVERTQKDITRRRNNLPANLNLKVPAKSEVQSAGCKLE